MEDFIKRIIEIDKQAREMTVDTESLKAKADEEIAQKNAEIKEKIAVKTDKAVADYQQKEQVASEKKLADKKDYYEDVAQSFGEIFEQNKDKWVDELVSRTLAQ